MAVERKERRHCMALRNHINQLLTGGASLIGRDPVRLVYRGQTMTVRHGVLLSEPTSEELMNALTQLTDSDDLRATAIDICLRHIDEAMAPYPPFRHHYRLTSGDH